MRYKRSTMSSRLYSRAHSGAGLLLVLLFFSGCASHPWGDLVDEQQHTQLYGVYKQLVENNRGCSSAYDGELVATLDTPIQSTSMDGYFQILYPNYIKYVVNNPLGQPLFGVAAKGSWFQVLNIPDKTYSLVSHRSYALRNDIPKSFLGGSWFDWITGRPLAAKVKILEIRSAEEAGGMWFLIGTAEEEPRLLERVLVDVDQTLLLERVVIDREKNPLASITYRDWDEATGCKLPMSISISGLSFGARADLAFSEVKRAALGPKDFSLPHPPGFVKKVMP